jgi:hypothetical protein
MKRGIGMAIGLTFLLAAAAAAVVTTTADWVSYTADGSDTTYDFDFGVWATSEVKVTVFATDGTPDLQVENSDYTVTLPNADGWLTPGGTVTFTVAPLSGYRVEILREIPLEQASNYEDADALDLATLEDDLDRAAVRDRQLLRELRRGLRAPEGAADDMNLPAGWSLAAGYPYWDLAGWSLATPVLTDLSVSVGWSDLLDGTTASLTNARAVRTQLGRMAYDVRADYGAAGTGLVDDTAAFTAWIAALNAAGDCIGYIPEGAYNLASATLAALTNNAYAITANGVAIRGAGKGKTIINITGTSGCSFVYAANVDDLSISDLTYVGNGVQAAACDGGFLYYTASADHNDISVERVRIEDVNNIGWVFLANTSGAHDIRGVRIRDNDFISRTGNIPSTGGAGVAAAAIRLYAATDDLGGITDFDISGNLVEGTYIKSGITVFNYCLRGSIANNTILNVGLNKATDSVGCYGILLYDDPENITIAGNRILYPWTCGVYLLDSKHIRVTDNVITDQKDVADGTLPTGAIASNASYDVTIKGGTIEDCNNAVEIVPPYYESEIVVEGLTILETAQADGGIIVKEVATMRNVGGVTIANNRLRDTDIRCKQGSTTYNIGNVTIIGNTIMEGHIYLVGSGSGSLHDLVVANNTVFATDETYGLYLSSVENATITGNRFYGPGSNQASTYGMQIVSCPLGMVITNNLVTSFYYGMQGQYSSAAFRGNSFVDVTEQIENSVAGDLGRENPNTIAGTIVTYWKRGQIVESPYVSTTGNAQGWMCVTPTDGLGCTYTTATTGDMTSGESVITGIAAIGPYIPGTQLTLANAAAGPATLTTEVLTWQMAYTSLTGTFIDGEQVEDTTTAAMATIKSDSGSVLQLTNVLYRAGLFTTGNTVWGCRSGATATIGALGLVVADACGATVNDAALTPVAPTFVVLPTTQYLAGSVTWDPASLGDGAGETSAGITVTGAALGDFVIVSAPYDLQDCIAIGYVQAANTVEIRLQNESTGTRDLASGTWRVRVISQ